MDLYSRLAITALIAALEDKRNHPKMKAASLKVFKLLWSIYSSEPSFRKVVFEEVNEP